MFRLFPFHLKQCVARRARRSPSLSSRRLRFERLEPRMMLSVNGDFNGDGFDDLAIGAPFEDVGGIVDAGAVNVVYGGRKGLAATGNQFWHQNVPGVNGVAAVGDQFGYSLAVGDFNGDGFLDLAIGVRAKDVNGRVNAGAVNVLYGSSNGLRAGTVDQLWTQDSPGINDTAEAFDQFGFSLAAGDFNGDGRDDLAIGVLGESMGSVEGAGMVNVLYGSASGLTNQNDQHWHQNSPGINDVAEFEDQFGVALVAGDFNGDGRDDLAVGVQGENVGTIVEAGAVTVIYGSASGLTGSGDQFWHQDSPGVADVAEQSDRFGSALAAGDFNGDGRDDLAIGVPLEDVGAIPDYGRINLLYGSAAKLKHTGGVKQLTVEALGFSLTPGTGAEFGRALAAGDFDGDGRDDLAIGAPGASLEITLSDAGVLYVAYGSSSLGLAVTGAQFWSQDFMGSPYHAGERFGSALVTGDYDGDGRADLAIGVPGDVFVGPGAAGAVNVLYAFGLLDRKHPFWYQGLLSASDGVEASDNFGFALG